MEEVNLIYPSAKPTVQINFSGFWTGFIKTDNFFYNLLAKSYTVIISETPDLLFFTETGIEHINYNCTKIFYTGENVAPDFMLCDFAFSYRYPVTHKNYRLPLYALYDDVTKYINRKVDAQAILDQKTKFCCFIVSNDKCDERNDFFRALSKYKRVDSGGRIFNNTGGLVENKLEFIKDYKFVIAFENTSYPGYTTEKVFEPLQKHCVPIYWGDPLVGSDFNTKCFINCHEYASFDDVIKRIIEVDNNDSLYLQYLNQPMFSNDSLNEYVKNENIQKRLDEIIKWHFSKNTNYFHYIRYPYFKLLHIIKQTRLHFAFLLTLPKRVLNKIKKSTGASSV